MKRRQAKFYLSEDAIGRLKQESERTTHSMSTIVNLLVARYLPEVAAEPPTAPRVMPEPENAKQDHEQEPRYEDVDFDF